MNVDEAIAANRQIAGSMRFMNEVWLNVQLTGWETGMGIRAHRLDLITTTQKFRDLGFIK